MPRRLASWINSYVEYASVTEAPKRMHFWSGIGVVAGALRRKVWIDMKRYSWYPSFYIVFVAPPGVVAKSTTADIGMDLLRQVPGIKFGPDIITWPALATAFAAASESFQYHEAWFPMSAINLVASELGNLINPQDRDMVNLYITLWDGKSKLDKVTKNSGNDYVEAPWINMMGCTTPHWIADNMPAATVGGGFTSRCLFIYADTKDAFIPYVDEVVEEKGDHKLREDLIADLEHISTSLVGPYTIEESARAWGRSWYKSFWEDAPSRMDSKVLEGYAARKQTHLHKTAMVLSASERDDLVITADHLQLANLMLLDIEADMPKVFARIGRTEDSLQAERFIDFVRRKVRIPYDQAYRMIHQHFPDLRDFEGICSGAIRSGQLIIATHDNVVYLEASPNGREEEGNKAP